MSILISAFSTTPRDLSPAENARLDEKSFFLSGGNWREHLFELFLCKTGDDVDAEDLIEAAEEYLAYHDVKAQLAEITQWHIGIANKLIALAQEGVLLGADRVGASD